MKIISMGLVVQDIIIAPVTKELFERDSTPVEITYYPGGDACNVACNVTALGFESELVSVVGKDPAGDSLLAYFRKHGIGCSGVKQSVQQATSTSVAMVEPSGERHFLSSTGIFSELDSAQLTDNILDGGSILSLNSYYRLTGLENKGAVEVFNRAHEHGLMTAMDLVWNRSGSWMAKIAPVLHCTDIFLPSYEEAVALTGERDVRAMREAMRPFKLKVFGVKLGERGSYVTDFKREYFVKPFRVAEVVSTVGAGDSYVAGFLTAQALGHDIYESAVIGSAAAAHTIGAIRAVGNVPNLDVLRDFIENNRN